jgi:hypothetical protein
VEGAAVSAEPVAGWCAPEVREELPELRLLTLRAPLSGSVSLTGPAPAEIRGRLRSLADRWAGAQAIAVRQRAVPAAYRICYRQIGLDPDVRRTPLERAVLERMLYGGFPSRGLLADILTIALVDTGVPVWALDAHTLDGPLGVRLSRDRERLGRGGASGAGAGPPLAAGQLVVADAAHAIALLFDEPGPDHAPRGDCGELELFTVQVAGVPSLHVEEALWSCAQALEWAQGES